MGIMNRDKANTIGHSQIAARDEGPATGDLPSRPLTDRELTRAVAEATLDELKRLSTTMSGIAARDRSQLVNNVLEVSTRVIPGDGVLVCTYNTQVGSILITNATGVALTVQTGTQTAGDAPTQGKGVQIVPNNTWLAIPIASHAFTIYGPAAGSVGIQVFTDMTVFGGAR